MTQSIQIHPPLNGIPQDIQCAQDYERLAPHFIPPDRLAYISGGSGADHTLQDNQKVFSNYAIMPKLFSDVSSGKTHSQLLGLELPHPLFLAPVAHQRLVHAGAELETARAADATDSCLVVSTLSSFSLEEIAQNTGTRSWFQLYFQPQRQHTEHLICRAVSAGFKALVITVDASVQQPSTKALRAGFQFPADIHAANLERYKQNKCSSEKINTFQSYMRNAVKLDDIQWLLETSPIPVIVKGVLSTEDALSLKKLGAAGIVVSNHGGRTIDGVPASLSVLSDIRSSVGEEFPLLFDSGIRSGNDVFKAIALGADAVLIGRLQLYALSIAGALGVAHMIKLLREELELAMAMAGCKSLVDIKLTRLHRN